MSCTRFVQVVVLLWIVVIVFKVPELKPKIVIGISSLHKLNSKFERNQSIDRPLLHALRSGLTGLKLPKECQ